VMSGLSERSRADMHLPTAEATGISSRAAGQDRTGPIQLDEELGELHLAGLVGPALVKWESVDRHLLVANAPRCLRGAVVASSLI
jgi:hypothetical protein